VVKALKAWRGARLWGRAKVEPRCVWGEGGLAFLSFSVRVQKVEWTLQLEVCKQALCNIFGCHMCTPLSYANFWLSAWSSSQPCTSSIIT